MYVYIYTYIKLIHWQFSTITTVTYPTILSWNNASSIPVTQRNSIENVEMCVLVATGMSKRAVRERER